MANKIFLKAGAWYKASGKSLKSDIELSDLIKDLNVRYPEVKEPYVPLKKYVGLLMQSAANAPTAIVLENTLGIAPSFIRQSVGIFSADLSSIGVTSQNTFLICGTTNNGLSDIDGNARMQIEGSILTIVTRSMAGVLADGVMSRLPVEIIVYP